MVSEVSMHTPLLLESVSSGSCTRGSILSPLRLMEYQALL